MFDILTDKNVYEKLALTGYLNVASRFSSKMVVNEYLDYYKEIMLVR
jgi:hypothetical protein